MQPLSLRRKLYALNYIFKHERVLHNLQTVPPYRVLGSGAPSDGKENGLISANFAALMVTIGDYSLHIA